MLSAERPGGGVRAFAMLVGCVDVVLVEAMKALGKHGWLGRVVTLDT